MNCQSCRIEIEELEMGETLSDAARAHVGACLPCGAFYNERLSLRRLVGSLEPVSAPPDFEFRLRSRLAASSNGGNHRFSLRAFIASAPAIGLAASFALLIAAVVVYNHFKSGPAIVDQNGTNAVQNSELKSETSKGNRSSGETVSEALPGISEEPKPNNTSHGNIPSGASNPHQRLVVNNRSVVRNPRKVDAGNQPLLVSETGFSSAQGIKLDAGSQYAAAVNQLVELPVRSSSQAMRVFVDDKSGGRHSVTIEPVIFGSQDFTGRNSNGVRVQPSQGIW